MAKIASKVFGVASASPAIKITSRIDEIVQKMLDIAVQAIKKRPNLRRESAKGG